MPNGYPMPYPGMTPAAGQHQQAQYNDEYQRQLQEHVAQAYADATQAYVAAVRSQPALPNHFPRRAVAMTDPLSIPLSMPVREVPATVMAESTGGVVAPFAVPPDFTGQGYFRSLSNHAQGHLQPPHHPSAPMHYYINNDVQYNPGIVRPKHTMPTQGQPDRADPNYSPPQPLSPRVPLQKSDATVRPGNDDLEPKLSKKTFEEWPDWSKVEGLKSGGGWGSPVEWQSVSAKSASVDGDGSDYSPGSKSESGKDVHRDTWCSYNSAEANDCDCGCAEGFKCIRKVHEWDPSDFDKPGTGSDPEPNDHRNKCWSPAGSSSWAQGPTAEDTANDGWNAPETTSDSQSDSSSDPVNTPPSTTQDQPQNSTNEALHRIEVRLAEMHGRMQAPPDDSSARIAALEARIAQLELQAIPKADPEVNEHATTTEISTGEVQGDKTHTDGDLGAGTGGMPVGTVDTEEEETEKEKFTQADLCSNLLTNTEKKYTFHDLCIAAAYLGRDFTGADGPGYQLLCKVKENENQFAQEMIEDQEAAKKYDHEHDSGEDYYEDRGHFGSEYGTQIDEYDYEQDEYDYKQDDYEDDCGQDDYEDNVEEDEFEVIGNEDGYEQDDNEDNEAEASTIPAGAGTPDPWATKQQAQENWASKTADEQDHIAHTYAAYDPYAAAGTYSFPNPLKRKVGGKLGPIPKECLETGDGGSWDMEREVPELKW